MKCQIIILSLLTIIFIPSIAQADILVPAQHCYQITNINEYPDYVFFSYGKSRFMEINREVNNNVLSCYEVGLPTPPSLYAIAKDYVSQSEIDYKNSRPTSFFDDNENIIKSNQTLTTDCDMNPGSKATAYWTINKLDNNELLISRTKVNCPTQSSQNDNSYIPPTEIGPSLLDWIKESWHFVVSGMAFVIMLIIFFVIKNRKSN